MLDRSFANRIPQAVVRLFPAVLCCTYDGPLDADILHPEILLADSPAKVLEDGFCRRPS